MDRLRSWVRVSASFLNFRFLSGKCSWECPTLFERDLHFTARRVCIARTMPWQDVWHVCPSVRPSVGPSFRLSHAGNPRNGGAVCKGLCKNRDFRPISRFISKTIHSHSYYERRIGNRTQTFEWCYFQWSEWPLTEVARSRHYSTPTNLKTVPYNGKPIIVSRIWLILSNGAIFSELERLLPSILTSCHY